MKAGKILLGVLSGAAAGAALGVLFAPRKGVDTRQEISDKSNDYINGSKNRINDVVNNVSSSFEKLKSKAIKKNKKIQSEMNGDDKIIY